MDCDQAYAVLNVDTDCLSVRMRIQSIFQDISNVDSKCLSGYLKCGVKAFIRIFQMKAFGKKSQLWSKIDKFWKFPAWYCGARGVRSSKLDSRGIRYVALFFLWP